MVDLGRCATRVAPNTQWGAFQQYQCNKKAVVIREGKAYCKIHDPEYISPAELKRKDRNARNKCRTDNCSYTFRETGYEGLYKFCPFCGLKRGLLPPH